MRLGTDKKTRLYRKHSMQRHIDAVVCLQHVDCGLVNVRKTGHKTVGPTLR